MHNDEKGRRRKKKIPHSFICGKILEHAFSLISLLRHSFLSEELSGAIKQEQRAETVFMRGSSSCQQQDAEHLEFSPVESVTPVSWLFLSAAFCFLICLAAHSVDDSPSLVFITTRFPTALVVGLIYNLCCRISFWSILGVHKKI